MVSPREQLIAAWRQQLADAECIETEPSSRAAWLKRLKYRLYCFLLSLYGDGLWSAPQSADDRQADDQLGTLIIDHPQVLPLAGKPAKAEDKIRAVLKSVADSQDHRLTPGTLTAEKLSREWFIVAAQSSQLDLDRCQSLLTFIGIASRRRRMATEHYLEVPGHLREEAISVLDRHLSDLRPKPHRSRSDRSSLPLFSRMVVLAVLLLFLTPQIFLAYLALEFSLDRNSLALVALATVLVTTLMLLSLREFRRYRIVK